MALSTSTIFSQVKNYLYNSGLGEKPSIRQGTGTVTVSGDIVTFDLAAGQGGKIRAGHVLQVYNPADDTACYAFYVISVSTDTLTCINGYEGSPTIANSAATPSLLEHQPPVLDAAIFRFIDQIVDSYLYPDVYDVFTDSFTPNLVSGQTAADADDMHIIRAWQSLGGIVYQIPCKVVHNMPTSLFATGKMLQYNVPYGASVGYSAARKVSLTNSTNTALEDLIAKGAAALALESTEASTQWESAKNDARERQGSPSRQMWQAFMLSKQSFANELAQETHTEFEIDRG